MLNGDVYVTSALVEALAGADGTAMSVMPVADPQSYGVVERGDDGRVTNVVEKPTDPPTDLANLGLYRFTPRVFEYIDTVERSERGEYERRTRSRGRSTARTAA